MAKMTVNFKTDSGVANQTILFSMIIIKKNHGQSFERYFTDISVYKALGCFYFSTY